MAQVSDAVFNAMNGGVVADDARNYYFLTTSDIATLEPAIGAALASGGYIWGNLGVFSYQAQFNGAFDSWLDAVNFAGARVDTLPNKGIFVLAVTTGGLHRSTGTAVKEDGGVVIRLGPVADGKQVLVLDTTNTTCGFRKF
jgi:hypothetical protein